MSNKLLQMVNARLEARGQKSLVDAAPTTTATTTAPQVRTMPGHFDIFTQSLDQPEAPPMGEVETNRRARLAAAAFETMQSLTGKERFEAARAKQQAAGLYQGR